MLCVGHGKKRLGLRADMDVLSMQEQSKKSWASRVDGRSRDRGHDGHIIMLLYAVEYLVHTRQLTGMLQLIFQPVEELLYDGQVMVKDGLFDRFPCDVALGLHSTLDQPLGRIGSRNGAMMASSDTLHIRVKDVGGHDTVLEHTVDATLVVYHIILALQSIVSRNITPFGPTVTTVGSIQAGHTPNIINNHMLIKLTTRTLNEQVRETVLQRIYSIAVAQAENFSATTTLTHVNGSPVLRNDPAANAVMREVAASLFDTEQMGEMEPFIGSEDFVFMLEQRPRGSYFATGAGDEPDRCMVHNLGYNSNGALLLTEAALWCGLAEHYLR